MTFITIKMFKDMRPSTVFRIACVALIVGGWIRLMARLDGNFSWILVGFTIMSLPYPIFLSAVTLVCNKWLLDSERTFWI